MGDTCKYSAYDRPLEIINAYTCCSTGIYRFM